MPTTEVTLPLLPATNGVVLPGMVVTIAAESEEAKQAFSSAEQHGNELVVVPRTEHGYATVGTVARVEQLGSLPNGTSAAVVRGIRRVHVGQGSIGDSGALEVQVSEIPEIEPDDEARKLASEYRDVARRLLDVIGGREARALVADDASPDALADTIAWWPALTFEQRVQLLETIDLHERLRLALSWAHDALTEVEVTRDIDGEVNDHFEKLQREAVLRRRMQAIQEELGESTESGGYREKLEALGDTIPDATRDAITKEIDHLDRVGEQSMESSWIRTWLDTVFEIPFATRTDDNLDLTHARSVLDTDHSGLDEVKDRIVEFLAVRKLRAERNVDTSQHRRAGTILVLAGPPGVGKTSLGESVARALGRKFVRTALGGIHDEAEIRGHRRTYVGARPGRIVRALIDSGSMNPVLLLDEIDKLGSDYRGDPTSALLEVLDPAQNHTFRDHYLELELDLSSVVFIATANTLERVPAPLLDRMEVITISGYSEDEKLAIAHDHLLAKVYDRNGVRPDEVVVPTEVVRAIIGDYTREAGVRRLEQRLDRVVRKAATKLAKGDATAPITVEVADLKDALGRAVVDERPAERVVAPGIATGLAVTGAGGDVLFVEAVTTDGEGLTLTGQLGDVMRESGEIALSYLRAHAEQLGIDPAKMNRRFHVHFPAGAVPKDGPSAGVTMTTAIASVLKDTKVRSDVAMTGEVTLQGRVLPIGGVKEKVLAAHRAGVRHVILPEANRPDSEDVPEDVREQLELHFASTVDDVLAVALQA
ncbi:MAG TPA: endopeptidase La [Acidimicrobiia bacterium]|jgi:ATP-dependent Lon protease